MKLSDFFAANLNLDLTGLRVVSLKGNPGTIYEHDRANDDYCYMVWDYDPSKTNGGCYAPIGKIDVPLDADGKPQWADPVSYQHLRLLTSAPT